METTEKDCQRIKNEIEALVFKLNPFGYLDLKFCIEIALKIGKDSNWVYDQIEEFCESIGEYEGLQKGKIDPCYVVYDAILQEARNEINNLTSLDIQNDCSFEVSGNFMCTSFDFGDIDKEYLLENLAENNIDIESLSLETQYFLKQIEIYQEYINDKIEELKKST